MIELEKHDEKMKIAVVGGVAFDHNTYLPIPNVVNTKKSANRKHTTNIGGSGSVMAGLLAMYGYAGKVYFHSQVGVDDAGKRAIECMLKEGVNLDFLYQNPNFNTPYSSIIVYPVVDKDGKPGYERFIVKDPADDPIYELNPYIDCEFEYANDYGLIVSDGKYEKEFRKLRVANPNVPTLIDAGRLDASNIRQAFGCTYVVSSEEYANVIASLTDEEFEACMHIENDKETNKLLKKLGEDPRVAIDVSDDNSCKMVYETTQNRFFDSELVITIGKYGSLIKENGVVQIFDAYDVKVIDPTAAGDIAHGAMAYAIAEGYSFRNKMIFAMITASQSTTKEGARISIPIYEEVMDIFENSEYSKKNGDSGPRKRR